MKMKSFAMFALSGVVAASFAYIIPAHATDPANTYMQSAADNDGQDNEGGFTAQSDNNMSDSTSDQTGNMNSDTNAQSDNMSDNMSTGMSAQSDNTGANTTTPAQSDMNTGGNTTTNNNDEATPDTATGDDDY